MHLSTASTPSAASQPDHMPAPPGGVQLFLVGSPLDVTLWITAGLKRLAPDLKVMTFTSAATAAQQLRFLRRTQWPNLILLGRAGRQPFLQEVQQEPWAADLPLLLLTEQTEDPDTQRALTDPQAVRASLQRPHNRQAGEAVLRLLALYSSGQLRL